MWRPRYRYWYNGWRTSVVRWSTPIYIPYIAPPSNQCVSTYDETGYYIWICGHWKWDAYYGYYWVNGYWAAVPEDQQWSPGYWYRDGSQYRWQNGQWIQAGYDY